MTTSHDKALLNKRKTRKKDKQIAGKHYKNPAPPLSITAVGALGK